METALEIVLRLAAREGAKRKAALPADYRVEHLVSINEPQDAIIYGERAAALREAAEAIRQALVDEGGPDIRRRGSGD